MVPSSGTGRQYAWMTVKCHNGKTALLLTPVVLCDPCEAKNRPHIDNIAFTLARTRILICMYVCRGIYVRAAAYSLNCHGSYNYERTVSETSVDKDGD